MNTEVREITPDIAKQMLKRNANNRKCSEAHVSFLSKEMINDNWLFDGQPIRFSEGGTLLDGQHRLSAVVKSGKAQKFLILTGIHSDAFKVMDTGKYRSAADAFKVNGVEYYSVVSGAARFILNHKKGRNGESGSNRISNSDLLEWYEDNKLIIEMAKESDKLSSSFSRILPPSYITALLFLFSEKSVTDAELFMSKLCRGLDLSINSPIYLIRKKLTEDKLNKAKLPMSHKTALIIKAWNFYRKGEEVRFLKWDSEKEKFPVII